jgi:hypothetical protein
VKPLFYLGFFFVAACTSTPNIDDSDSDADTDDAYDTDDTDDNDDTDDTDIVAADLAATWTGTLTCPDGDIFDITRTLTFVLTGDAPSFSGTFELLIDAKDTNGELGPPGGDIRWTIDFDVSVDSEYKEAQKLTFTLHEYETYVFILNGVSETMYSDDISHPKALMLAWDGEDTMSADSNGWDGCTGPVLRQ